MKKERTATVNMRTLSEIHRDHGLPVPAHPLISLIDWPKHQIPKNNFSGAVVSGFYRITLNIGMSGKSKYGQGHYDYSEGGMTFVAPTQVISPCVYDVADNWSMYTLLIHPDFLWNYPVVKTIKQYGFFSYNTNEALHLSDKERNTIISIFQNIEDELNSRIDEVSQDVIIAQIELLLNYANRFYKRQFITRKVVNNDLLQKMDDILDSYLSGDKTFSDGIPTVHFLAEQLHVSPSYLSDMVRSVTGQNALGVIHQKIIEKAKEKLSITNMTVSEVAYELGFGHPSSFTKLFKAKTNLSPLEFRKSFN
ncbi:helix-turn-helix transcriptional regulator [Pedobacter antarcticus]|uniref:helix-turn-helix domain-containing protein n=1 Tax=Pedobacter antarcticus TaxID=34086 RepID=UPI00292F00E4|nr:helix-turn-helix transcriptional regulator [Pedobacter antarcticus]